MPTYLSRYLGGEYERVWSELLVLGPAVREQPVASDAYAVARETMRRAGENVRRIIARLEKTGYRFEHAPMGTWIPNPRVYTPPTPGMAWQLTELEAAAGPLPLSLRAWFEVVGEVSLMGWHPAWDDRGKPDPLEVDCLEGWVYEYGAYQYECEEGETDAPFVLSIAPDYYHKANVSGGSPYGIELPCAAADAPLLWEWHETNFVDYLRITFQWGGFPGWQRLDLGQLPGESLPESARPSEYLAYLSANLLPL